MKKIIFASNNKYKIAEFKSILKNCQIVPMKDIGFTDDIEETGTTFLENAKIKAQAVRDFAVANGIDLPVISDDAGLCVEALDNQPGVYSARYAGENSTDDQNRQKLLAELKPHTNRRAYFISVLALIDTSNNWHVAEGRTYGDILHHEKGNTGFAFDCLFHSHELDKCFAEATSGEKNSVSHRGKAIEKMKDVIDNL